MLNNYNSHFLKHLHYHTAKIYLVHIILINHFLDDFEFFFWFCTCWAFLSKNLFFRQEFSCSRYFTFCFNRCSCFFCVHSFSIGLPKCLFLVSTTPSSWVAILLMLQHILWMCSLTNILGSKPALRRIFAHTCPFQDKYNNKMNPIKGNSYFLTVHLIGSILIRKWI